MSGVVCLIGLAVLALLSRVGLSDVGPPATIISFTLLLVIASASASILSKRVGLAVGESSPLDALGFSAILIVAMCASVLTAVFTTMLLVRRS